MTFTGVLFNTVGVFLAGLAGSLCKKGIPGKVDETILNGLGLCVLAIGIMGLFAADNVMILIVSVTAGTVVGEMLRLDERMNRLGALAERYFPFGGRDSIAEGLVTGTFFVCVGAMSITGAIESGTQGTWHIFFAKTLIDSLVIFTMSTSKGIGCGLSAFIALIYQSGLTLGANYITLYASQTVISEMSQVGSILIIGIALNMLGVTRIRIGSFLPAPFFPIVLHAISAFA